MLSRRVSVIVPAFNASETIEESLNSALLQTMSDLEIVVVDDGSSDNTVGVVQAMHTDRVRIIQKQNGGAGSARHAGVQASSGSWLAFLDADDLWAPRKLENQLACAVSCDAEVIYTNVAAFGDCENVDAVDRPLLPADDVLHHVVIDNPLTLSSVMMSRSAYDLVGGFSTCPSKQGTEDWDLWLRLAASGIKFAGCEEALTYYRWSESNQSSNYPSMHSSRLVTLFDFLESSASSQLGDETIRTAKRNLFMTSAWSAARNGGTIRSLGWLARSAMFGLEWKTARHVLGTLIRNRHRPSFARRQSLTLCKPT